MSSEQSSGVGALTGVQILKTCTYHDQAGLEWKHELSPSHSSHSFNLNLLADQPAQLML